MLHSVRLVFVALGGAIVLSACGGGGSGDTVAGPPPPNPLYVRTTVGRDTNVGDKDHPLQTISKAAQIARTAYTIYVGAGIYHEGVTTVATGIAPHGLEFIADATGANTGERPGGVVVDASSTVTKAGFKLSNSADTLIDGFTIMGATDAGIVIKSGSDRFTIQNCIVHDNAGDGIRVQDSASVLVFNNLVYNNGGFGIGAVGTRGAGSPGTEVFSNTIYGNADHGITIGNTDAAAPNASVHNNIIEGNDSVSPFENIKAITTTNPPSDQGFDGDYNLVFPASYNPTDLRGSHDLAADAMFVNPTGGDFHLQTASKAIDRGGALNLPDSEINILHARTTIGGKNNLDSGRLDLGFHYLP